MHAVLVAACCASGAVLTSAAVETDGRTRDRPPPAHTGGFGEPTCEACHFGAAVDQGAGSLRIEGLPDEFEAGRTYTLHVVLTHPGVRAAGFQMTARHDDGSPAGTLAAYHDGAGRIDTTTAGGVSYIHHSYDGSEPTAPDTARWSLQWTAPGEGGDVVVHAAANAADGDDSPLGDFVYSSIGRATVK